MNWPSAVEREQVERALQSVCRPDNVHKLAIFVEQGSPWLQIEVWIWLRGTYKLALWRATGAVHELDRDGAAIDPPLLPGRWSMETL